MRGPVRFSAVAGALVLLLMPLPASGRPAQRERPSSVRIETDFSFTTNLVHWVDNLAGTSVGKTMPFYRRYWEERFGPPDAGDRAALEDFASIRRAALVTPGHQVANESGCLPVAAERLGWHQLFLSEAMTARSLPELRDLMSHHMSGPELEKLMASLERFRPRFERVWKDLVYVRRFDARFHKYLARDGMVGYLESIAVFLGVTPRPDEPMKISFIGLPSDGPTHAEADGDHLLIEIRPTDAPRDQVQVVAHEGSHFLMRRMTPAQVDAMARQAFEQKEAGALFWRYVWEGLPTALGQGLAEARLTPDTFSLSGPWYHIATIDRFAKLIYPGVAQAVNASRRLDDGLVSALTRTLAASPLYREARPVEFLMTGFYASGELADEMAAMRSRLDLRGDVGSVSFALGDAWGGEMLRRYVCLGGVALLKPEEVERAALLDGTPMLSEETRRQVQEQTSRGAAVIATGRRAAGAPVFFLVVPRRGLVEPLVEAFGRLRGLPDRLILITGSEVP